MEKEIEINLEPIEQKEDEVEKNTKKEIKYDISKPPYFIQGSFVLDKIFNVDSARDIDVFMPEGSELPEALGEEEKSIHRVDLPEDSYFPPLLGCYNTDRYLLVEGDVVAPDGFPEKPEKLELLGGRGVTVTDVIRGIKISLRYDLPVSEEVQTAWQKTLEREFDPEWMKSVLFDSEEEVLEYITDNLREETGEGERQLVAQKISEILKRKVKV